MQIPLGSQALARARFAVSPLHELDGLLRCLRGLNHSYLPPVWAATMRTAFVSLREDSGIQAVLALQSARGGVEFVVPPPHGPAGSIDDDLAAVASTPREVVARDVAAHLARTPDLPDHVVDVLLAEDAAGRVAQALHRAWEALMAEHWPTVLAVCQRDISWRLERLGRGGWDAAFQDLHQRLRWHQGSVQVNDGTQRVLASAEEGLVLVPSLFVAPALVVLDGPHWPLALVYPARGVGLLRESVTAETELVQTLGELLGFSRARVLLALDAPAGTTQIARSLDLAVGAVGDHLAVLHRAGLVTKMRVSRSVPYQRTAVGSALVRAARPSPSPQARGSVEQRRSAR